ncbi:McrB family protein [Flavobacterium petrolei]|uniref:McrB family protein n=1 Tax=Flavobacterium petrolei TaxID=2259594 RepID=UPI0037582B5B
MISYKDYEKQVYDWLMTTHNIDANFTFSLRQKGSKGSELDYFIGTGRSKYFATTFWTLPVNFPGSSSDCINLIFSTNLDGYSYLIEFNQTNSPDTPQNQSALNLLKSLKDSLLKRPDFLKESKDDNKMFSLKTKSKKERYSTLEEMIMDVQNDLDFIFPVVAEHIALEKTRNPDFVAHRITPDEFENMHKKMEDRFDKYSYMNKEDSSVQNKSSEIITKNDAKNDESPFPLNQILYGPPGTGKTYNTVLEAAKIVTGKVNISYSDALKVFNNNLNNQIEFITFHQNYSYEDFIQGIRPDTENGKELSFEKKDGVFKRIADRALKNTTDSEKPESAKKDFDAVFQNFILPLIEEDEIEVKMKKTSFYITQISEKSIEFRKNQGDSQHTLSINTLRKMYNDGINEIILGGLQPYYNPILQVLLEKGKSQFTPVEKKNFVIIIDEINRANISRVFGELITLIEEDKRYGGKIPMRVTLPSGDPFIVPSNLYIIGTMNTADKSIALLDIALRRRFEFVPKYPDPTVEGVYDSAVLSLLNKAIQSRKGYDFTIGHAYFMGDDYKLENTVNKKVIPLLLEYFMNNEEEVIKIFKEANINIGGWPLKMIV